MLTLLPHLLCSPSPPFCFPVTPAAEIKLTSLSLDGISELRSQTNFVVLQAEAGDRWDTAAAGEGAGRQHKGHSEEAAWRAGAAATRRMLDIAAPQNTSCCQVWAVHNGRFLCP